LELKDVLVRIYEDLEIKSITTSLDSTLTISDPVLTEETKEVEQKKSVAKNSDEWKVEQLTNKDDVIIKKNGEIVDMPAKNKKCPCRSKKNYKNCECFENDSNRRTEFINKVQKKIGESRPINNNILML
jgi:hydrogenase maturation factor HypE